MIISTASWNNSEKKCIVCGQNCGKPALLDLFSGAGGAARGYQRAGFCVLGVDIKPQPHYAGCRFVQADAMSYPLDGFDVIHASPPCQGYSRTNAAHRYKHPRLISAVRARLWPRVYVIENVQEARASLISPVMLCGSMVGLPTIQRHRYFEINPSPPVLLPPCNHIRNTVYITGTPRPKVGPRKDPPAEVKRLAMGTPWMTIKEMDEAIPPAYTLWIGQQLMEYLNEAKTASARV